MGYESLLGILRENYAEYQEALDRETSEPIECPNDGEPLSDGPDGVPFCRFDGWRPRGAPTLR